MSAIDNIVQPFRDAAKRISVLGIVLAVLGVLSIAAPFASGLAIQWILGIVAIAAGIAWITFSFHAHGWGSGLWEALVGILAVISGVVILDHPVVSLAYLTLVLAAYFVTSGILRAVFSFRLRGLGAWGWVLVNGLVSILLGVLLWEQWPMSGFWAVGTLFGIDLLFAGFGLIQLGSAAKSVTGTSASAAAAS